MKISYYQMFQSVDNLFHSKTLVHIYGKVVVTKYNDSISIYSNPKYIHRFSVKEALEFSDQKDTDNNLKNLKKYILNKLHFNLPLTETIFQSVSIFDDNKNNISTTKNFFTFEDILLNTLPNNIIKTLFEINKYGKDIKENLKNNFIYLLSQKEQIESVIGLNNYKTYNSNLIINALLKK